MKSMRFGIAAVAGILASAPAFAEGPVDDMFAAVDFTTVSTNVTTIGVAVVGIVLAYKAIDLVKRAVNKV